MRLCDKNLLTFNHSSILSESSMSLEPPTPPTRTSEKLKADLEAVNSQLSSMKKQWEQERRRLVGDNAALQDATTRLNVEVRQAKSEIQRYAETERAHEKAKAGMQGVSDDLNVRFDALHMLYRNLTGPNGWWMNSRTL